MIKQFTKIKLDRHEPMTKVQAPALWQAHEQCCGVINWVNWMSRS